MLLISIIFGVLMFSILSFFKEGICFALQENTYA